MALNISIFIPKETVDNIHNLENFITNLGDLLNDHGFGNELAMEDPDETYLEKVNSFIIIKDEELPNFESFHYQDMFLVIPIENS